MSNFGPSVCFQVQKIIGVSIGDGNTRNYQVQWAPTWINSANLLGCEHLIDEFVKNQTSGENRNNIADNLLEDFSNTRTLSRQTDCFMNNEDDIGGFSDSRTYGNGNLLDSTIKYTSNNDLASPFSHVSNEEDGQTEVICMDDGDASNPSLEDGVMADSYDTNPNFEWRPMRGNGAGKNKHEEEQTLSDSYEDRSILDDGGGSYVRQENGDIKEETEHPPTHEINNDELTENFSNDEISLEDQKVIIKRLGKGKNSQNTRSRKSTSTNNNNRSACHTAVAGRNHPLWKEHTYFHSEKRTYECMLCNTSFATKGNLTTHFKLHTGYKPYQCLQCNKFFSRKHHLTDHLRLHTGEKPFQCEYCNKAFTRNHHLKDHIRVHHKVDLPTMVAHTT